MTNVLYFSGLASVDYSTWHSPIVLSGTCNEVSADGKCSSLSVWYVYKGKGLIPSSVMSQKSSNGFDTNVIHALDASAIPKFGLHQTRVLYGSIVKDTFVLEPLGMICKCFVTSGVSLPVAFPVSFYNYLQI